MHKYSVEYWGSDPDLDNDDCWTGSNFETLEEAEAAFNGGVPQHSRTCSEYILLMKVVGTELWCGKEIPAVEEVKRRKNPDFIPDDGNDDEWQREIAMQAGMAFGCDGYNDAMGYTCEPYEPEDY